MERVRGNLMVKPMNIKAIKDKDKQQAKERFHRILEEAKKKQTQLKNATTNRGQQINQAPQRADNDRQKSRLKRENKKLQKKVRTIQTEKNAQEQLMQRLKAKNFALNQANDQLEGKVHNAQIKLQEADQLKATDYHTQMQLKQTIDQLNQQIQLLNKRNRSLRTGIRHFIKSSQYQKVQQVKADKQYYKDQLEKTRAHLKSSEKRNTKYQEQLHQYRHYELPGQGKLVRQATTQELINELFARIDEERVGEFLSLLPLFNMIDYYLKTGMANTKIHLRRSELLKDNQQMYGYVHFQDDQPEFIALDGSVFPNPVVKGNKFELNQGDVYRGNYNLTTDQFVINKHYAASTENCDRSAELHQVKKNAAKLSAKGFVERFTIDYPDVKDVLTGKNNEVVSWFKQISYKRVFEPFGVNIDVLDPNERSGDFIYRRIENTDTDLAFILLEGSHHVNSQIYKDRPAANPDKIKILEDAAPKELLKMTYDHFKSLATRTRTLDEN